MRIYVDQHAISRNAGREEQEPVFIVEHDNGRRERVHGMALTNARLCYDKAARPRAWIEVAQ